MVTSIVPGATAGAGALGIDTRLTRQPAPSALQRETTTQRGDQVSVGSAASWAAARDSVRAGLAEVHQALATGHAAQAMLLNVQALAREGGSQTELAQLMQDYADKVDQMVGQGAKLISGAQIEVHAEPGAAPVVVQGADLRLKDDPALGDVLGVSRQASVSDETLAATAQRSLEALQGVMDRLFAAARGLEAHQSFLGAAEGALAANADLDADGARLLALQVSQGLGRAGSIANVEPQAVLALFKT